jgi:hypothetical protein
MLNREELRRRPRRCSWEDCRWPSIPPWGLKAGEYRRLKYTQVDLGNDIQEDLRARPVFLSLGVRVRRLVFPDFTIQFVDAFPDVKIQVVEAFPGIGSRKR